MCVRAGVRKTFILAITLSICIGWIKPVKVAQVHTSYADCKRCTAAYRFIESSAMQKHIRVVCCCWPNKLDPKAHKGREVRLLAKNKLDPKAHKGIEAGLLKQQAGPYSAQGYRSRIAGQTSWTSKRTRVEKQDCWPASWTHCPHLQPIHALPYRNPEQNSLL